VEKAAIGAYTSLWPTSRAAVPTLRVEQIRLRRRARPLQVPYGETLEPVHPLLHREAKRRYRADAENCNACPLKPECTLGDSGRVLMGSFEEEFLERLRAYREGPHPTRRHCASAGCGLSPSVRGGQGVARDEALQAQEALAGERRGDGEGCGTEHKAAARLLGQRTEETGAGRGPVASGTDPFGERPAPPGQPSSEIHTAPCAFFNGLTLSTHFGE
jgi:hypothetical protein